MPYSYERADVFARFMRHVSIGPSAGDCWLWTANAPGGRHGHFAIGSRSVKAHRWIYGFVHGEIPDGQVIRHKCDVPQCVNPQHLEAGTCADNTGDMIERGRNPDRAGEKHPLSRLTEHDVLEIRRLHQCGQTHDALADRFRVSNSQVGKIVRRENWRHI